MISTDYVTRNHHRAFDGSGNDDYDHEPMKPFSKKRNTIFRSDRSGPSNTTLTFSSSVASESPSPSPSPTTASNSFDSIADVNNEMRLPKQIVTLNVVRPVPKRISEQFYDEAYREGSTLHETNQAAIMAHDWHRKWVYQDEEYHTMPEEDFFRSSTAVIPVSYRHGASTDVDVDIDVDIDIDIDIDTDHPQATNNLLLFLEREEGAKNPSPGTSHEGKRKRFAPQAAVATPSHHQFATEQPEQLTKPTVQPVQPLPVRAFAEADVYCGYEGPAMVSSTEASLIQDNIAEHDDKRRFVNTDAQEVEDNHNYNHNQYNEQDEESDRESFCNEMSANIQRPMPIRPLVVKPMAIRANRSEYIVPQPAYTKPSPFAQESRNGSLGKDGIPRRIIANDRDCAQCVSPMSFSQIGGSYSSSPSGPGSEMAGMTVFNKTEQEGPHLVVDEYDVVFASEEDQMSISSVDKMEEARDEILRVLAINDDVESEDFKSTIRPLEKFFAAQEIDTRSMPEALMDLPSSLDPIGGMWLTLSKPNFFGKLGENDNGDPLYTLGRMSFDMFSPTNLICSLQGNFNRIEIVEEEERKAMLEQVPTKLREEVESGKTALRTYHVVTAFTIEPALAAYPNAPNKDVTRPIKGIMTTYGYSLPDPNIPNRHSVWFTGGRIEPNNDMSDVLAWKSFFTLHPPKHSFGEKAKLLAVKLLMGATIPTEVDPEDGSMNYVFTRPLGGHGMAYVDVIYLDDSLRIARGHKGTVFVFSRISDVH